MVYKSGQIFLPFCHNPRVWQTHGQTDGRTDRNLLTIPLLHYMQRDKKVLCINMHSSDIVNIRMLNFCTWCSFIIIYRVLAGQILSLSEMVSTRVGDHSLVELTWKYPKTSIRHTLLNQLLLLFYMYRVFTWNFSTDVTKWLNLKSQFS